MWKHVYKLSFLFAFFFVYVERMRLSCCLLTACTQIKDSVLKNERSALKLTIKNGASMFFIADSDTDAALWMSVLTERLREDKVKDMVRHAVRTWQYRVRTCGSHEVFGSPYRIFVSPGKEKGQKRSEEDGNSQAQLKHTVLHGSAGRNRKVVLWIDDAGPET